MAKPTFYPDWAVQDTTLPATGQTNKVRPREQIRNIGWDKGQIPTAEELNWTLNNQGLWIRYLSQEVAETLPTTYLPQNGTTIELSGDLQGTITFNGSTVGTGSITVLDNSHNHLSANISDATFAGTANVIAKRGTDGSVDFGRAVRVYANSSSGTGDYWLTSGLNGNILGSYGGSASQMWLYFGNGSTGYKSRIDLYNGYITITNPRSANGQEGQANSLVRFDYLTQQVNNLQNNINNLSNQVYTNYVQDVRLGATYTKGYGGGSAVTADSGGVLIGLREEQGDNEIHTYYFKPVQKLVNGNWYTVGQL